MAHAQRVERGEGIGPELDAGADFADVRGLLQQLYADALAGQGQCGGQAADAPAGDQDRRGAAIRVSHGYFPQRVRVLRSG